MDEEKWEKSLLFRLFQGTRDKNESEHREEEKKEQVEEPITESDENVTEVPDETDLLVPADGEMRISKTNSNVMKVPHNYLEAIRCNITLEELEEQGEEHIAYFSDFTYDGEEPDRAKKVFLKELQRTGKSILEARKADREEQDELQEPPLPVNAHICIKVSSDGLSAWLFAFPPENGGKDISDELVWNALNECRVQYGLDETMINKAAYQRVYLKLMDLAHGTAPVEGTDGKVVDYFPRILRSRFEGTDDTEGRSVDFKNLNWLHPVSEGTVICDVIFPVESRDGRTVTGVVLPGRKVARIVVPNGFNTALNSEKTALVSLVNGTLYYEAGKFHVKDVLNIMSDVDLTVGNIDTIGNVDIRGDVLSGFRVQATGNIMIRGMVGNSTIIAGGNIRIGMGIRGNGEASIECGGTLNCVYIENCTVRAHGAIFADSIINSDVISDDEVESQKIVGGTISALNKISARVIGNNQHRPVVFNLGITQQFLFERTYLERRGKELENELGQTVKSIRFLNSKKRLGEKETELFQLLSKKAEDLKTEKEEITDSLENINEKIHEFSHCVLEARSLYPPVTVSIRSDAISIDREQSMCRIYSENGEIRMS